MTNILVVTGSVRPNSVNEKIVPIVVKNLEKKGVNVSIADLGHIRLPFFNDQYSPSNDAFAPTDEGVQTWTNMVRESDGVIFVTPEYNRTMSPIQLNAIDWIYKEWRGKPVAFVGYGWGKGGGQAHDTARESLGGALKARVGENQTNLFFTKDIDKTGTVLDEEIVSQKIDATIDELLGMVA